VERFELHPVLRPALPEVAAFLHRWRSCEAEGSPVKDPVSETAASIERRLRWLLVDNPAATPDSTLGYCLCDGRGVIRGLNLCYPVTFLSANKWITGLGSGSFYVEPAARSLGFYLFKKYLGIPGYSFYFCSTCNTASSQLWRSIGSSPVPNSETEYILPLRLNAMIPAYVASRTSNQVAARFARMCGSGADPVLRLLTRSAAKLTVELCQDWEKLAELSRQHRTPDHITSDRSPALLQWRYGPGSPSYPCGVYLFRDKAGREGWFALGHFSRGKAEQFRASVLLDVVWPRELGRPGLDFCEYSRFVISRRLEAPQTFVSVPKGVASFPLDLLDYDDSDYIAWTFQWRDG